MHPDQVRAGIIVAGAINLAKDICLSREIDAEELDLIIETYIRDQGGIPSLKGYTPSFSTIGAWNHSLCLSLNYEIVHGIPTLKRIKPTDLIKIDLVVKVGEWHADAARTFSGNPRYKTLIRDSLNILDIASKSIACNGPVYRFGEAVKQLAEYYQYYIPEDFCGHGIGNQIHDSPCIFNVPNYSSQDCFIPKKTYAVEPVIMENECIITLDPNQWTYMANKLSTHNENTYWVDKEQIRNLTDVENFK